MFDRPDHWYDPNQLCRGIACETQRAAGDPELAKSLAKDNLDEIEDYYGIDASSIAHVVSFENLEKAIHVDSYWEVDRRTGKLKFIPEGQRRPPDHVRISRGHDAIVLSGRYKGHRVTIHHYDDKQNAFSVRFQYGGRSDYIGANKMHFPHIHEAVKPIEYEIKDPDIKYVINQETMRGTRKGPSTLDDDECSITRIRRRFDTGEMAAMKNKSIEGHLEDYREALMKEGVSERGIKKEMARAEAEWKANLHKSLTTEDLLKIVLGLHETFPNRGVDHE